MGLFVAKLICERMGGDICCFSASNDVIHHNQGSIFEFRMQMARETAQEPNSELIDIQRKPPSREAPNPDSFILNSNMEEDFK